MQTRSAASKKVKADSSDSRIGLTTYTTLRGGETRSKDIQVISKRKLVTSEASKAMLRAKFDKIEKDRLVKEKNGTKVSAEDDASNYPKTADKPNWSLPLFIIHLNVFLYATCFFIQTGTLPYLTKKLGADPATFGRLQTAFALAQLLGGPIYGRIGDLFGEKVALIAAFASASLSYLLMGFSDDTTILFASRIPSVFMHVMQGSQMFVTGLSDETNRATALSRLGFSYGIGMVMGPTLGGKITTHFGEQEAALFACAGSVLSLILVIVFLPNHIKKTKSPQNDSILDLNAIFRIFSYSGVKSLLAIKLICGIPIGIFQSMFSVIAMERFGLPADQNGMLMSYIGIISLFMQGFGISFLTKLINSDHNMMVLATASLTFEYLALVYIYELSHFIVLFIPMVASLCVVNSILTASVTKAVPETETGVVLGLNMAVNSSIRSLAPTIGGYMINDIGYHSIGILGVLCNIFVSSGLVITRKDSAFKPKKD